jgi:integrase
MSGGALKKRGNGEGSISRRNDGRWCGRYYVNTSEGRKRKAVYGKTKAEVLKLIRRGQLEADGRLVIKTDNPAMRAYLDIWLSSVKGNVRTNTYDNYRYLVKKHIEPHIGNKKIQSLQSIHIEELYNLKLIEKLSGRTVRLIHTALHSSLKQAVEWGYVRENVTDRVRLPKSTKKEICPLTRDEAATFLEVSSGTRFETLYVLAIHTGLRKGELLGLRWKDVDFTNKELRVRQQLVSNSEGLSFGIPKSGKARSVRLSNTAVVSLLKHKEIQDNEKRLAKEDWPNQELVFRSMKGTPMNGNNLSKRSFKPLLEAAGLPNIRFHDLRHTFATLLLEKSMHPKIVQEMLGHASIAITLDTYSHVLPSLQSGAAVAMDELFGEKKQSA